MTSLRLQLAHLPGATTHDRKRPHSSKWAVLPTPYTHPKENDADVSLVSMFILHSLPEGEGT